MTMAFANRGPARRGPGLLLAGPLASLPPSETGGGKRAAGATRSHAQRSEHGEDGEDRDLVGAGLAGTLRRGGRLAAGRRRRAACLQAAFRAAMPTNNLEGLPTDFRGLECLDFRGTRQQIEERRSNQYDSTITRRIEVSGGNAGGEAPRLLVYDRISSCEGSDCQYTTCHMRETATLRVNMSETPTPQETTEQREGQT
jgi:hypothetical protein